LCGYHVKLFNLGVAFILLAVLWNSDTVYTASAVHLTSPVVAHNMELWE